MLTLCLFVCSFGEGSTMPRTHMYSTCTEPATSAAQDCGTRLQSERKVDESEPSCHFDHETIGVLSSHPGRASWLRHAPGFPKASSTVALRYFTGRFSSSLRCYVAVTLHSGRYITQHPLHGRCRDPRVQSQDLLEGYDHTIPRRLEMAPRELIDHLMWVGWPRNGSTLSPTSGQGSFATCATQLWTTTSGSRTSWASLREGTQMTFA